MQTLYRPEMYPQSVRNELATMPPLATEIANRWAMGWMKTVKALLASGEYLEALRQQEAQERDLFSRTDLRHLARHEICELYGLSPMPPHPTET